jgi:hypothetical protein
MKTERSIHPRRNDKLYASVSWRWFSQTLRRWNPICQMIQRDGTQCRNASELVHHVFDAETYPHWMRTVYVVVNGERKQNTVCLCWHCHSPGLREGNFVPTVEPKVSF